MFKWWRKLSSPKTTLADRVELLEKQIYPEQTGTVGFMGMMFDLVMNGKSVTILSRIKENEKDIRLIMEYLKIEKHTELEKSFMRVKPKPKKMKYSHDD